MSELYGLEISTLRKLRNAECTRYRINSSSDIPKGDTPYLISPDKSITLKLFDNEKRPVVICSKISGRISAIQVRISEAKYRYGIPCGLALCP